MKKILKKYFGYDEFRPLQEEIINNTLKGRDGFVLMPTGGGKSLCFQVPALKLPGLTLVISPLIALMKDQVDALKTCGVEAEFINSSLKKKELDAIYEKLKNEEIKILYVAPERFAVDEFQEILKNIKVSQVAIDEAHCISEWGHDFRPDYRSLSKLKTLFPDAPIVALTATATEKVKEDIVRQLRLENSKSFVASFNRENLEIIIQEKKNTLKKIVRLLDDYKDESVIIYCLSRKDTESLAENLRLNGYNAKCYHAGLKNEERRKAQEDFIKDRVNIIVATIAFGMGIDKPDVRLVIHHTYPKTLEGYYQEIGRAGRDGLPSKCVMFYTYADTRKHEFFINISKNPYLRQKLEDKLAEVLQFSELTSCRKKFLLDYFGERLEGNNCKSCDNCLSVKEFFDATIITQKILSTIIRLKVPFGKNYIIQVLLGKNAIRIKRNKHNELPVFGIVDDFSEDELSHIINHLYSQGLITKSVGKFPTLSIGRDGVDFINKKKKIELPKFSQELKTGKKEKSVDIGLLDELKTLRKQIAEEENIPPFMVFGDKTLQEMTQQLPKNKDELLEISGVGMMKLENFGDQFLCLINEYCEKNKIERNNKIKKTKKTRKIKRTKTKQKYYSKTKSLLIKKIEIKRIAKNQGVKIATIVNHIEKLIDSGENLDLEYLKLPKDRYNAMKTCFEEYGDERLKPIFEALKGKYSYDELRLVRALINLN